MRPSDVTVVMCTYNGERYVETQLMTILQQTLPPAEIVVSDDGSTDKTLHIVESVAASTDVPIRVHVNESQLGYAANFLHACRHVRTAYIAFSDQDDEWAPTKLEVARTALEREDAVLCAHAVEFIDSDGALLGNNSSRTHAAVLHPLQSDPMGNYYGFTMVFDRLLLDLIPSNARGGDPFTPDAELSHDRWIYFLASTFGRTVVLDECLARYRQHARQLYGGGPERPGRIERLTSKLAEGQDQARFLAGIAAHRSALLGSYAPSKDDVAWRVGAARWRTTEQHFTRRADLYGDLSTIRRLALLTGNLFRGTYLSFKRGGLGPRRLAEDLMVTVALAVQKAGFLT